ncbi:MAG: RNA polymerase sigma factor [Gammaproteobacteria bacterium]|nr:RNA polymerase sigma factor [Gammaproteobacteria bacterium]
MHNTDDYLLVQRVLQKDRQAFERFFEVYFARLFRFCSARVTQADACEDIVQETLFKAMTNLSGYRGEASLFTWLCQICRHEISNWYQRSGRKSEVLVSLDDDPGLASALESLQVDFSDEVDRLSTEQLVQLTLDYLPDRYGKALEWKYLEGLSVSEIAARLGTGSIAAQSLLARARRAFRRGFRDVQQEMEATT